MSMTILDDKLSVINTGTYELVANEGETKCYSVQTMGTQENGYRFI